MNRRTCLQYMLGVVVLNLPFKPFKLKKMPVKVSYIGVIPKISATSSVNTMQEFSSKYLKRIKIEDSDKKSLQDTVLSLNSRLYSSKMRSNQMIKTDVVYKDFNAFAKNLKIWKTRYSFRSSVKYKIVGISYGVVV